jgi:hypothetical protein
MEGATDARPVTLSPQKLAIQGLGEIEWCRVAASEGGYMIRQTALRTALVVAFGGFAAGCSETGFQDFIGAGKVAPDETQVTANQPLTVPPDLQLRPPSNEEPKSVASLPPANQQQPAAIDLQQPQDYASAPQAEPAPAQPQAQPQQQASTGEAQDAYARAGVSRYHPDGREKTQLELNEEMRQKKIEADRQRDPNYGTIWNLGSVWGDG